MGTAVFDNSDLGASTHHTPLATLWPLRDEAEGHLKHTGNPAGLPSWVPLASHWHPLLCHGAPPGGHLNQTQIGKTPRLMAMRCGWWGRGGAEAQSRKH